MQQLNVIMNTMDKKQKRQQNIINYIQRKNEVSNSDILDFLGDVIERTTLQRDLNFFAEERVYCEIRLWSGYSLFCFGNK